jgi:hypothetical protein
MAGDPVYQSTQELEAGPAPVVRVPEFHNNVAAAASQAFGEAGNLILKIKNANDEVASINGLANYYTELDKLRAQYRTDDNPGTAPARFEQDVGKLQASTLANAGNLGPEHAARLRLQMTTKGVTDLASVRLEALGRQKDATEANLEIIGRTALGDASTAATPVQKQEAMRRYGDAVDAAAKSLLISKQSAALKKIAFQSSLDHADAMHAIATDPVQAATDLANPGRFPGLTPVQRETFREHADNAQRDTEHAGVMRAIVDNPAQAAADLADPSKYTRLKPIERENLRQSAETAQRDPEAAAAMTAIAANPKQAAEDLANPGKFANLTDVQRQTYLMHARNAIDKRGVDQAIAAGGAFPAAASMIAGRIIHPGDVDDIYNKIIAPLEGGPAPAGKGLEHWRELGKQFGGNVPLMMAAYSATPDQAGAWRAAAEKKFGPDFTAEQLVSVIPDEFKPTRDYIAKVHATGGARLDAFGVSPAARYEMGVRIGHELTEQQNSRNRIVDQLASVAMANDPVIQMLKDGIDVDPGRLAQTRAALVAAAATGNVENIKRLRDFDFAASVQPQIQQAYRLPFPALDALVNAEQARISASGANPTWQEAQRLQLLTKVRDEIASARKTNPTGLMVRAGLDTPVAIDPNAAPDDPGFRAALARRGAQALTAQKLYGGSAIALTPNELTTMKSAFAEAGPDAQFGMLRALGATLQGPAYTDTVAALAGDNTTVAYVGQLAQSRPDLAHTILQGQRLRSTRDVGDKALLVKPALSEKLGGQMFVTPAQQDQVIEAALSLYTARKAAGGQLYDTTDSGQVEQAIEDVAGKIVSRGGRKVAVPLNLAQSDFNAIFDNARPGDFDPFGGAYDRNGQPFDQKWLASHARLQQLAPTSSRYAVMLPTVNGNDGPVMSQGGAPLVIDMDVMARRYRADPERQPKQTKIQATINQSRRLETP